MTDDCADPSILLLEDDDLDAELIAMRLKGDGVALRLDRAKTKEQFQQLLSRPSIVLILSDFSLPTYDGLAALELARERARDVPFIFVSGAIGEERAIETMRRGATDYVLKDRLERLGPAVRRALSEAETRRLRERAESERDQLLVSERQAREAAESANRMKDEFLAIVSHELRTPLNAILGWASLLDLGKLDAEKQKRGIEAIGRNARMQARIIDDILDVSRIVSGKLDLHRSRITVGSFVLGAVDAVRPSATAKGLSLVVELTNEAEELDADAERLQQVVWNLVTNAVKFTEPGGAVQVTVGHRDEHVVVEVSDTGAGIAAEFLPHIFEAFRQGDASKTRAHRGLGLGLAIVRHLVSLHGGRVEATSPGLGLGSSFRVWIPINPESVSTTPLGSIHGACRLLTDSYAADHLGLLNDLRVLVVDDDPEARDIVSELLRTGGAEVFAAESAQDALEAVAAFRPAVVVSDIGMPGADGYSLLRKLRARAPKDGGSIPAIALSAYARDVDRSEAERAGYQRHLAKPVSPRVLVTTVAELVGRG